VETNQKKGIKKMTDRTISAAWVKAVFNAAGLLALFTI
jgi:hypothetical protein